MTKLFMTTVALAVATQFTLVAAAMPPTTSPFDRDLPYALGTAIAYSDGCRDAGYNVGDVAKALDALRSAAPEAVGPTLQAARMAAERLGRSQAVNAYLPEAARRMADLELVRPTCDALANSTYGSVLVRHSRA